MATKMDVLAKAIRENILETLETNETDKLLGRFPNATILLAFNRAVKVALTHTKQSKGWVAINVAQATRTYDLPALDEVSFVKYNGTFIHPQHEVDMDMMPVTGASVSRYALLNEPPTQIKLDGTPANAIASGLKLFALIFPSDVEALDSNTDSPLKTSYDEFLINYTTFLLLKSDEDDPEAIAYRDIAFDALSSAFNIERPKFDRETE